MDLGEATRLIDEHNAAITKALSDFKDIQGSYENYNLRLLALEQRKPGDDLARTRPAFETAGMLFCKQLDLAEFDKLGCTGKLPLGRLFTKATPIDSTQISTTTRLPLVDTQSPRLLLRDQLGYRTITTTNVEFPRELTFVNSAAIVPEKALKPESSKTFEIVVVPAVTIAHWIHASRQAVEDAPQLAARIDSNLLLGIAIREENLGKLPAERCDRRPDGARRGRRGQPLPAMLPTL